MRSDTVVTIGIGEALFALPVSLVQEILDPRPVSPLPRAPSHLLGLVDVRGVSVAVVDLRRLLSEPDRADAADTRIIVLRFESGGRDLALALRVDRVIEVTMLDEGRLDPLAESRMLHWDERMVAGIGRRNGAFVTQLSLDGMFDPEVLQAVARRRGMSGDTAGDARPRGADGACDGSGSDAGGVVNGVVDAGAVVGA